jgi:predicted MFS family arabinose efflux permease
LAFGASALVAVLGLHAARMPLRPRGDGKEVSPWPLLRDPALLSFMALGGILLISVVAMGSMFTVFAKDRFDKDIQQLLPEMITLGVGAVVGVVASGKLTDRLGPRPILVWASVAVTVFFVLVPPLAATAWAVYPVFFLMSALAAARVAPYQALMLHIIPENARGPILGLRNVMSYLGTGIGAGGGGYLYEVTGSYQAVAIFAAVFSALALWIAVKYAPREWNPNRQEETDH